MAQFLLCLPSMLYKVPTPGQLLLRLPPPARLRPGGDDPLAAQHSPRVPLRGGGGDAAQ